MGGTISPEEVETFLRRPKVESDPLSPWKGAMLGALQQMGDDAERENATEAINSLTAIVMETKNPLLADSCRKTIALLLDEFAPSKSADALIEAREREATQNDGR